MGQQSFEESIEVRREAPALVLGRGTKILLGLQLAGLLMFLLFPDFTMRYGLMNPPRGPGLLYPFWTCTLVCTGWWNSLVAMLLTAWVIRMLEEDLREKWFGLVLLGGSLAGSLAGYWIPGPLYVALPLVPASAALGALWRSRRGDHWLVLYYKFSSRKVIGGLLVLWGLADMMGRAWYSLGAMLAAVLAGYWLMRWCERLDRGLLLPFSAGNRGGKNSGRFIELD